MAFSYPIYLPQNTSIDKIKKHLSSTEIEGGYSHEIYFHMGCEICINGEWINVRELRKEQRSVYPYSPYEQLPGQDAYYFGQEIYQFLGCYEWDNVDDFDIDKLEVVYKRITFQPLEDKKWTHLYLSHFLYDGEEPTDFFESEKVDSSIAKGPYKAV